MTALGGARPIGTGGAGGGGGGSVSIPVWTALPTGTTGDVVPATLGGVAITARKGASIYHPAYATKAQLEALWPTEDQFPGVRIGPFRRYHQGIAEQKPIKILWQTDSNGVGQGATGGNVGCRAFSAPKLLATRFGWRDGMAFSGHLQNSDPRVSQGGWNVAVASALGGAWQASGGGQDLVFTSGIPCDSIRVTGIAVYSGGGTTTVYVDGVSVGTINHSESINGGYALPQLTVAVARGNHVIRCTSDSSDCWINRFETFDSLSTAPELYHCGVANARMQNLYSDGQPYDARFAIAQIRPDIGVLWATINDLANDATVPEITAGMDLVRRNYRENGGEFIGVCGWACNRAQITPENLDLLLAHLRTRSQEDGTACADIRAATGHTYALTPPEFVADADHLTAAGYAEVESVVLRRLFE